MYRRRCSRPGKPAPAIHRIGASRPYDPGNFPAEIDSITQQINRKGRLKNEGTKYRDQHQSNGIREENDH